METKLLQIDKNCATVDGNTDMILISRQDLEIEHRQLLSRLHQIRRLLGYPELQTGHKKRIQPER